MARTRLIPEAMKHGDDVQESYGSIIKDKIEASSGEIEKSDDTWGIHNRTTIITHFTNIKTLNGITKMLIFDFFV